MQKQCQFIKNKSTLNSILSRSQKRNYLVVSILEAAGINRATELQIISAESELKRLFGI